MHLRTRTWFAISLLCFILAGYFWHLGIEKDRRDHPARTTNPEHSVPIKELGANNFRHAPPPLLAASKSKENGGERQFAATNKTRLNPLLTNRLSNTSKSLKELTKSDSAVLLRNALIDTSVTDGLNIPQKLRAKGDPGSYVVQSRGLLNDAFRARVAAAGATIVSYIPNNSYLIHASEAAASQLRALPQTLAVLPWEPYYKLDLRLLSLAVQDQPLPANAQLNVLLFPGERESGLKSLEELGAKVLGENRSPFGQQVVVQAPPNILTDLAALPVVQAVEVHHPRQVVNDLTRVRVGVSTNSYSPPPDYLGLNGSNVLVSINDTGVWADHPDLVSRVVGDTGNATQDLDGHGTHVAGIIAGDGSKSSSVMVRPQGSATNGPPWDFIFRGMAPKAMLFAQQIDLLIGPVISDEYLQETAARTNALISNNSWGYVDSLDYDLAAASYDAAARDAIPEQTGPEPLLFVFAAGNSGSGGTDGQGGQPESIASPATSKNSISVGAIEKARGITNVVTATDGTKSEPFFDQTDADNQVAYFSSRGNVGVGVEGENGRFKPDVVAPGEFVISCRSDHWKDPTNSGGVIINRIKGQVVQPGKTNAYDIFIPGDGVQLTILTRSNLFSPYPFPSLPIYANSGTPADTNTQAGSGSVTIPVTPGQWSYAIGDPIGSPVNYDLITIIHTTNNPNGDYFQVLAELNADLAPWYRYESGTSQAAPAVSGILALMQQFFEQRLGLTRDENWPALLKAMVINGARSMSGYDREVQTALNLQGWGVVNLTNSLPAAMNDRLASSNTWPLAFFHANTLYTGQSHTRTVALAPFAVTAPLRITLVWTDPPGNPAAGIKLVNDLDLIVSNNIPSGEVYYGNNIPQGSDFNAVIDPTDTNAPPIYDLVNNVENVFINRPLPGTNFTVTVRAHRVNVNAVTGQTNGVLQDYALVISSGNTNALTVSDISVAPQLLDDNIPFVQVLTNDMPRLNQRVGANNPEINVLNNGITNQWNFYVYNNTTGLTNVVFGTFVAPNLSRPRFPDSGADIDLYVSPNPALTNLDPAVVADAIAWGAGGGRSSRERGGTEAIIFTNPPTTVFYLAVKSEDQQAAEFELIGHAFNGDGLDGNGNLHLDFFPAGGLIPDGSPEAPKALEMFGFTVNPGTIRRIVLTNIFTHENAGDLVGILTHPGGVPAHSAILNNHRSASGTVEYIYDDSRRHDVPGSQPTDGPGHLRDFLGDRASGFWRFLMIDNAQYHTGRVDLLTGLIEPDKSLLGDSSPFTLCGNGWLDDVRDVPFNVTNMIITVSNMTPVSSNFPLDVYIRLGDLPDLGNYDKRVRIFPPGGSFSFSVNDSPGLQPGNRYFISLYNPDLVQCVSGVLRVDFQYSVSAIASTTYLSPNTPLPLVDDAVTNSIIVVTNNRVVADVQVGVRIDHPRVSDLVLHLVSPQGTRIMLSENRGGFTNTSYGVGQPVSYTVPVASSGSIGEARTNIDTGQKSGIVHIDYQFFDQPDDIRVYYDGKRIFDSGVINGGGSFSILYGPGISTVITVVMNEGNPSDPNSGDKWNYTATIMGPWNYATFVDDPNLGGPIKFALPPYYQLPTNRLVLSNSFEGVDMLTNQTNFALSDPIANSFAGWQVLSNGVAVFSDFNHTNAATNLNSAYWGTNYLALSSGQVCLPLTNIVPDRDYVLNFVQRKVSSSPTQTVMVTIDVVNDTKANLYHELNVPNPPVGNDANYPSKVPELRLCPGQEVLFMTDPGSAGDTNAPPYNGLPLGGLIGCFSFSPEVLTSNTVAGAPFYVGYNSNGVVITAPTDPGDYYLFLGINIDDFGNLPQVVATNQNMGTYVITAQWQQCQYASGQVLLGGNAFPITGSANWKVETIPLLANPTMTNLCLQPDLNTTLLFDSFEIDEVVSTAHYQSEEPLAPLVGESALGNWRLEVWDNRAGPISPASSGNGNATNDTGMLFSWSLRFIFADGPAAIPLTNGVIYSGTVVGNQTKYFVVAVPNEVTEADNLLNGNGVQLSYSPFGLPTGQSPPDPVPAVPAGPPLIVNTTMPLNATLPQGKLYYLGVQNIVPASSNNFAIHVDFNIPIVRLPKFPKVLGPQTIGPNPYSFSEIRDKPGLAVTNMNYYFFDIASTDIVSATISVQPFIMDPNVPNGDVNVVLRRALPVVDLFPRPTFFDYESTQPALGNELIIVNSNSLPVNLTPGRWYVGVYNTTNAVANYTIRGNTSKAPLWDYVDLTNAMPVPFTVSSAGLQTNFYRFLVDQTNAGVLFEIYGDPPPSPYSFSGNVDLLVKRADLPSRDLYDFSFLQNQLDPNSGFFSYLPELMARRTNIFIPDINATNWFVQIASVDPGTVSGWICAKVTNGTNALTDCQDLGIVLPSPAGVASPLSFAFNSVPGEKYVVEQTPDLKNWYPAKVIKATNIRTSFAAPAPTNGTPYFYRVHAVGP